MAAAFIEGAVMSVLHHLRRLTPPPGDWRAALCSPTMAVTIHESGPAGSAGVPGAALHAPPRPIWSPPLLDDLSVALDKNPLWRDGRGERQLLLATDGRPVGRVLAHVHRLLAPTTGAPASSASSTARTTWRWRAPCWTPPKGATARAASRAARAYDPSPSASAWARWSGLRRAAAFSQSWNAPHLPRLLEACGLQP
jgi:hypothetical protein